jgi:phosphoenolpyruvate carboxylase
MEGLEAQGAGIALAGGDALVRHFQAMVDRIANQMDQRIADLLEHGLVQLGGLAAHVEHDLLVELLRQVADQAREAVEHRADRQHADAHDAFLQLARVARQLGQAMAQHFQLRRITPSLNWLSIDWVMTSSPTRLIRVSIFSMPTRTDSTRCWQRDRARRADRRGHRRGAATAMSATGVGAAMRGVTVRSQSPSTQSKHLRRPRAWRRHRG